MQQFRRDGRGTNRTCRIFLLVLSLVTATLPVGSVMAEERSRSARFDEAVALFAQGEWERAIEVARQAWTESRESFGPEDMRTFEAEGLWLTIRIYQRDAAGLPYDDLSLRLLAVREKSVVRRDVAHEMTWHYGESAKEWPNSKHIVLTYVAHPNYTEGIYSSDLAGHLEALPSNRMCVVFEVTYDAVGKIKGYRMIEIGGLTRWNSNSGYANRRGGRSDLPSPWREGGWKDSGCSGVMD